MDISPRKSFNRSTEPVDDWLNSEGYFRKHVPRDSTCLFRAFAEQIYSTQHYHIRVRRECISFMRKNRHLFEQSISIPYESYLEQMSCFTEWGGPREVKAMSLLYERKVFIFDGIKTTAKFATDNGFQDAVYLCLTPQKQYESVYPKEFISTAGFCQSIVYRTLYKDVFEMSNIDETVKKMLHDRPASLRHDRFFLKGNLEIRDKLATELLSTIERESEETSEEEKSICRGVPPFPYKVAKALDPNIYRNTDFDIWNELRREVKNAGWTRWNGSELQVGSKCLVQIDYRDKELDETNNNFGLPSLEKVVNGNTSKESKTLANKRERTLLYGHIQEMSKDEGPVVVFIEEIGEKRTVPFAALKPISQRRNKQNNWSPNACRRNPTYDTNQKWKKTWNSNGRKSKDSSPSYGLKNSVDTNNNGNDDKSDDKSKKTDKVDSWNDESSDERKKSELKKYTMETFNSCQGFTVENTVEVRPVTVLLDNVTPSLRSAASQGHAIDDYSTQNSSQAATKNPGSNDSNPERGSPNVGSLPPESVIPTLPQVAMQSANETAFYPPPHAAGMPAMFPVNQNMICSSPDGNAYPVPFPFFTEEPPPAGSFLDRTIRAINFSAPTSLDLNGSDLPFSDTVTLRFFYNLGLEYFRSGHAWGYGPNGQAIQQLPPNFAPPANFMASNSHNEGSQQQQQQQQASTINEDENIRSVNAPRQNYATPRRRNDNPSNLAKYNNQQQRQQQQQQSTKMFTSRKNDTTDHTNPHKSNESVTKPPMETYRSQTYTNNDKSKDYSNPRKNPATARYRKNCDGRSRNYFAPSLHQQDENNSPIYRANSSASEAAKSGGEAAQQQEGNQPSWKNSSAAASSSSAGNQQANYQTPYGGPQAIYTAMPYYPGGEGEGFYAHGPGFYPIPFVPAHTEIVDGNAVASYAPPLQAYSTIADAYPQPVSALFPPYLYPQQAIFPPSALPHQQQNHPDNWFPLAPGQAPAPPQYTQYPPMQNPPTPTNSNVNVNHSAP